MTLGRTLFAVMASALGVGLAVACSAQGTPNPSPDPAAEAGAAAFETSACGKCIFDACGQDVASCKEDAKCSAYVECLAKCPVSPAGDAEATCEAACAPSEDSVAIIFKTRLDHCRSKGSGAACTTCGVPAEDGGADSDGRAPNPIVGQSCGPAQADSGCTRCEEEACCKTRAACMASPECDQLLACTSGCPTTSNPAECEGQCYARFPAAAHIPAERIACLQLYCARPDQCAAPNQTVSPCFACVQKSCPNEFADCYADPDCRVTAGCAFRCQGDVGCTEKCLEAAKPGARRGYLAFNICTERACPECIVRK